MLRPFFHNQLATQYPFVAWQAWYMIYAQYSGSFYHERFVIRRDQDETRLNCLSRDRGFWINVAWKTEILAAILESIETVQEDSKLFKLLFRLKAAANNK
jgi:hypothetical protein